MITKKEIERAAIKNNYINGNKFDTDKIKSFKNGIKWFRQELWHLPTETPDMFKDVLIHQFLGDEVNFKIYSLRPNDNWKEYYRKNDVITWCYITDLFN